MGYLLGNVHLDAYFDESLDDEGNIVVAGLASTTERWTALESSWRKSLSRYGVPHFHMTAFRGTKSSLFRHLPQDQRDELFAKLLNELCRYAVLGVTCRISQKEYESLTLPRYRSDFGTAYSSAFGLCVITVERFLHAVEGNHTYSVYLENGHRNSKEAIEIVTNYRDHAPLDPKRNADPTIEIVGGATPRRVTIEAVETGPKDSPPMQTADILAHCTLRQSEPFCKTVLEFLRKNILHRDIGLSGELLHAIIANTIIHELKRREERAELHEVSRFFGHFGVKIRPVKGGVMLDGRNRIPFDLAHMERIRAIDPTIVWTDPEGKIIDAALTEPDREEPWL